MRNGLLHYRKYQEKQSLINSREAIKMEIAQRMLLNEKIRQLTVDNLNVSIEVS